MHTHISNSKDNQLFKEIQTRIKKDPFFKRQNHNRNTCFKFLLYLMIVSCLYYLILNSSSALTVVLSFMFFGVTSMLGTFNFSHELSHGTIFKSKQLNHVFYKISLMLVGAHAEGWKHRHIHAHHHAPNVSGYDPDLDLSNLIRVAPNSEYRWYHRYQHFYAPIAYMSYTLFWAFIKDTAILIFKSKRNYSVTVKDVFSFLFQKAFYFAYVLIIPLLFSTVSTATIVGSFLAMHCFQSLFLLLTFFMTHHVAHTHYPKITNDGKIESSWFMNQVQCSNDMNPFCPVTTFILGGFNTHIAHHLFPNIHHTKYVKLSKIIYEVLDKQGLKPVYTSYWGGVLAHLRLLRERSIQS